MTYAAPIADMRFVLDEIAGLPQLALLPGYEEATEDLVGPILEEAGKLAADVLAPLNHSGDQEHAVYENGVVRTPRGFPEAYRQFVEGGWGSLPFSPDHGGQSLPWLLATAVQEMWQSANLSFSLCPLLTAGAVELLEAHGTPEQKDRYLPKMVSGDWSGTMNLTEPQSGSDLSALKTKAVKAGEHYLISGQKIYITWGEHDCTENIIHMVLARTPDAPPGSRGISLFIVPKFMVKDDGALGQRNDLRCVSLERKLGINASPTAVMSYGDDGGAVGYLVGQENRGLECMFTMMNNARLTVGLQGVAIAERAYQQARDYAKDRVQGRALGGDGPEPVAIVQHPDVRRNLMTMRALTEAARALTYLTAAALDSAKVNPDPAAKRAAQARCDILIPICKAWSTDAGCEIASLGVQVHGGMGFIEETGAAQHYRDCRILPIYEGTNGIQALDLLVRKLLRDGGAAAKVLLAEMAAETDALNDNGHAGLLSLQASLAPAIDLLGASTDGLLAQGAEDLRLAAAGATPYLRLFGIVIGGWLLARGAAAAVRRIEAGDGDAAFLDAKIKTAHFYADNILPQARALAAIVAHGAESTLALDEAQL